tara:strand:- start:31 stop:315 length:285 start_codon:yes stop_codon:yes gene_type:complete
MIDDLDRANQMIKFLQERNDIYREENAAVHKENEQLHNREREIDINIKLGDLVDLVNLFVGQSRQSVKPSKTDSDMVKGSEETYKREVRYKWQN